MILAMKKSVLSCVLLAAAAVANPDNSDVTPAIVGGDQIDPGDYPYFGQ